MKKDSLEDSITISLGGGNEKLSDYEIKDISEDGIHGLAGDILACVDGKMICLLII